MRKSNQYDGREGNLQVSKIRNVSYIRTIIASQKPSIYSNEGSSDMKFKNMFTGQMKQGYKMDMEIQPIEVRSTCDNTLSHRH